MKKLVDGDEITFYEAEVHASDGGECLRIEDADITDEHWFSFSGNIPYQYGPVEWVTGEGFFSLTGKIAKPYKLTFKLTKEDEVTA